MATTIVPGRQQPDTTRASASEDEQQEQQETLSSETLLWLPNTVVKKHRKKATIIWISLLIAFFAYVAFIVWDTVDSRRDPAASFQLKGFLEEELEPNSDSEVIEENFYCKSLPVSTLTVNQTGIENEDINHFYTRLLLVWNDDPNDEYDPTDEDTPITTQQFVGVFFQDVNKGVEGLDGKTNAAKLPYDRVSPVEGETFFATVNHVVLDLMTFQSISATTGRKQDVVNTYTQATTSGQLNWYWDDGNITEVMSVLIFDLFIPRFEFTSVEEVDPVDAWAILGAVGGVWQFVIIAFGLFFVFSEKQPPDKKIRNFRKSVAKPAAVVARRFSRVSMASTFQDADLDASDEDLPREWVKKQKRNGSVYYYNTMTREKRDSSPNEAVSSATGAPVPSPPRRMINLLFKQSSHLPPGWIERYDDHGRPYYVNTVMKTSQRELPQQRLHSTGRTGIQVVDAPMSNRRRESHSPSIVQASDSPIPNFRRNSDSVSGQTSETFRNRPHGDRAGATQPSALPPRIPAAAPCTDAVSPPLPPATALTEKAPSYRTITSLMKASAETVTSSTPESYESVGGAFGDVGAGGNDGVAPDSTESLPPGWQRCSTSEGKT